MHALGQLAHGKNAFLAGLAIFVGPNKAIGLHQNIQAQKGLAIGFVTVKNDDLIKRLAVDRVVFFVDIVVAHHHAVGRYLVQHLGAGSDGAGKNDDLLGPTLGHEIEVLERAIATAQDGHAGVFKICFGNTMARPHDQAQAAFETATFGGNASGQHKVAPLQCLAVGHFQPHTQAADVGVHRSFTQTHVHAVAHHVVVHRRRDVGAVHVVRCCNPRVRVRIGQLQASAAGVLLDKRGMKAQLLKPKGARDAGRAASDNDGIRYGSRHGFPVCYPRL